MQIALLALLIALLFFAVYALAAVKVELSRNAETALISQLSMQSAAFSRELNTVQNDLRAFSSLLEKGLLAERDVEHFRATRQDTVFQIGIISLVGDSDQRDQGSFAHFPVLYQAAQGEDALGYVEDFLGVSGVMFATPVRHEGVVTSVLYEVKLPEHMAQLNRSLEEGKEIRDFYEQDLSLLLDPQGSLMFPLQTGEADSQAAIFAEESIHWQNQLLVIRQFVEDQPGEVYLHKIDIDGIAYTLAAMDFGEDGFTSVRLTPPSGDGQDMTALLDQCILALLVFLIAVLWVLWYLHRAERDSQEQIFKVAYIDRLTQIYNWDWVEAYLLNLGEQALNKTLVLVDVKDFRTINQLYGREHGDMVLQKIARSLEQQQWADMAARCGSDSFLLVVERRNYEELRSKLNYIFRNLRKISPDTNSIYYRCGVVDITDPLETRSCLQLLDECSNALNSVNTPKKTDIVRFTPDMRKADEKKQQMREELLPALERGEFEVFYQAKYEIATDLLAGAEALIRWNYKGEGYISPGMFIPLFEEDGTVKEIDRFVYKTVCEQFATWKKQGLPLLPISVNLSRVQMDNENIVLELSDIADKYGVGRRLIQIEITESGEFQDLDLLVKGMRELKEAGFGLAMDDFGTGYSSFSMLTEMPLEVLKIDKSFVDKIQDHRGQLIVSDIISMAKHLNISCLAEGVEEKYQRDLLQAFGCDYVQGFFYSKPTPVGDYEKLLKEVPS